MNIQTKYSIGDTVWFMGKNKIVSGVVAKIQLLIFEGGQKEVYWFGAAPVKFIDSSLLFPSKEELIKSL
jgi:hypothetical protein